MQTIETVDVNGSPMEVFLFSPPAGASPHPALVLAQHIPVGHTGIENDEFTLVAARRFAAAGYVVAAPFIFHWWPKDADIGVKRDESRDVNMVADLRATWELLDAREDVDSARIGVAGHCWGGRVAWLGACHLPFAACAVFYGGRIKVAMGDGPAPIELAGRIQCPIAGYFGNEDSNPSPADVEDYAAALDTAGVEREFHAWDDAGHAFQNFPSPERYREAQSEDAWGKVLDFLARTLANPPPAP